MITNKQKFRTFQNKTRKNTTTEQFPEKLTDNVFICINYKTSDIDKFIMNETWKTFTLTFVEYVDNDDIGKMLAILSLSPLVIVIVFLTVFACKRDLHTCTFGIGTILNGVLNYVLKHTVKESRPTNITNRLPTKLWEQYGWPSSHSQYMCFVSFYLVLFFHLRLSRSESFLSKLSKLTCSLLSCALAGGMNDGQIHKAFIISNANFIFIIYSFSCVLWKSVSWIPYS